MPEYHVLPLAQVKNVIDTRILDGEHVGEKIFVHAEEDLFVLNDLMDLRELID